MFDKTGEIKFIDFGVAVAKTKAAAKLEINGSPVYMSPEVFTGSYDKETDIWSLGVTLFFLASYQLPFDTDEGQNMQDLIGKILRSEPVYPKHFSEGFKDLLK